MRYVIAIVCVAAGGCAADGEAWQGSELPQSPFHLYADGVGVHPSQDVLDDPANLFAQGELTADAVWRLQQSGGNVAAFYAWATLLARGANGERQYYAALDLKGIYDLEQVEDDESNIVRKQAIRGFQAMLDYFPDAVTYDATGTIAYELATPAVQAILALDGDPVGWVLVSTPNGDKAVPR
jgi:hypothetical protein